MSYVYENEQGSEIRKADYLGGFFQIYNFLELFPYVDGNYQLGQGKARLRRDTNDEDGWFEIDKQASVNKSKLLVSVWELELYRDSNGMSDKIGMPESNQLTISLSYLQNNLSDGELKREGPEKPLAPEDYVKKRLGEGLTKEKIASELRDNGKTYYEIGQLLCSGGSYVAFDTIKKRGERLVKKGKKRKSVET
jgi:hypothetical protein